MPGPQKRVRSGCLTCRGRRRKCDEGKPKCSNCQSRNLTCRYGVNVTFVQSKFQQYTIEPVAKDVPSKANVPRPSSVGCRRYSSPDNLFHVEGNDSFVEPECDLELPTGDRSLAGAQTLLCSNQHISHPGDLRPELIKSRNVTSLQHEPKTVSSTNFKRDQYETELIIFYRYYVAPTLDLGLGSLFFGIQTVLETTELEALHNAVLALASSRRAAVLPSLRSVDDATSVSCAHFANQAIDDAHDLESMTASILLACRILFSAPIEGWPGMGIKIHEICHRTCQQPERWNVLARLHLSTVLCAGGITMVESLPPPNLSMQPQHYLTQQLCQALWIVERNLSYLSCDNQQPALATASLVQTWLSCWEEVQKWYTARSEDMRQLFELVDADTSDASTKKELSFPCIVFSSGCAVVANVAHHVAAMILLQKKPRLVKATAEYNSTTSLLWHAQRVLGIIITAIEAEIWDCFLVAALIYAAQKLSHTKQTQVVADALKQISGMSGLQLASAVEHFERQRAIRT